MIAARAKSIAPFLVMDILEAAQRLERAGRRVVHLEIGEPDFDAPDCVKAAADRALAENRTHYTHSQGIIELREAICEHHQARYGVAVHPDRVIVTQGTSPGMLLLFSSLMNPGDAAVISDPGYACYANCIGFCGGRAVRVPVFEDEGFQYLPERIAERLDPAVRAVVLNSPANPTGTLLSAERMREVAGLCGSRGIFVVSDEIYHGLVYEGREHSILEFTDQAFVLNGFSKLYAMTGFRLGYLIAPGEFVAPMRRVCQNLFISANSMAQWAGIAALREAADDVERMRQTFDARRRCMLEGLARLGFTVTSHPTGAFYVLVNARHLAAKFGGSSLKLEIGRAHV